MAGTFHFQGTHAVEQGATNKWQFTIYEGATATPGEELDLSGYLVRMQVRETVESEDTFFEADSDTVGGIELTDAPNGEFQLIVSAEDSADLVAGEYIYQIELVNTSNEVQRILAGNFIVSAEVVR